MEVYALLGVHHQLWYKPQMGVYTLLGVHYQLWHIPEMVQTTSCGLHHQLWHMPGAVHATNCGPHHQPWPASKSACTTDRGSHHRLWHTRLHETVKGCVEQLVQPRQNWSCEGHYWRTLKIVFDPKRWKASATRALAHRVPVTQSVHNRKRVPPCSSSRDCEWIWACRFG